METGKLIKELRIKKGMTQEELAELTELSVRTIQRIENGAVDPRAYTLQMIAKALEVDFRIFAENETEGDNETKQVHDNNWLGLLHLSGIIPLIIPTMLMWNLKKDRIRGINDHYGAVISYQLMIFGIILGCLWVYWKINLPTPLIGVLVANALFTIMNTLRVINGEAYMHPFFKKKS